MLSVLSGGGNVDPPDFFIGSDDPVTGNALGVFDNAVDSYLFALGNGCSPVDVLGKCIQIRLLLQGDCDGFTVAGRIREDGFYILQSVFTQFKGESDDCVFGDLVRTACDNSDPLCGSGDGGSTGIAVSVDRHILQKAVSLNQHLLRSLLRILVKTKDFSGAAARKRQD